MIGIQYLAPSHLPTAAEGGWKRTKVMKNNDTAKLRSSGLAPMSLVKPAQPVRRASPQQANDHLVHTLGLRISYISTVQSIEEIQKRQ
jgi:hypothetical protein